jgi:lysophospholipase L1-like esterase
MGLRGGFDNGLKRDILPLAPKAITIDYGMNDARSAQWTFPQYGESLAKFADRLHEAGARVAILTASPEERYEADQPGGSSYNQVLAKYAAAAREVAEKHHAAFADQFAPFIEVIAKGRAAGVLGANGDPRLIPDGVHPNWAGHLVMASCILEGLGAPALVSRCAVDAPAKAIGTQEGCACEFVPTERGIAVRRADQALPWPIPPDSLPALAIPGFKPLDELSRYDFAVTGLKPGRYDVAIDDQVVGGFPAEELAAGVNLTTRCGPIRAQALKLHAKIIEKNNVFYERWRTVQIWQAPPWLNGVDVEPQRAAELAKLDARIAALEAEIDALRRPVPHVFSVQPTPPARPLAPTIAAAADGIALSWRNADAGATGLIERSDGDAPFKEAARVDAGVATWKDASPGAAQARYRVRALSADAISAPSLSVSAAENGSGLAGAYCKGRDLAEPAIVRVDAGINFPTGPSGVDGIGAENFSVRWSGTLDAPADGAYTIAATADDGVRLWLDGQLVIDQWKDQAPTEYMAQVQLKAGQPADLVLEYYQGGGGAAITLAWSGPGLAKEVIPAARLHPARCAAK